jgi:NADH-quinone oxidoreductase subunit E
MDNFVLNNLIDTKEKAMIQENRGDIIFNKIESIINKYNCEKSSLISILLDVQAEYNYLPREALLYVAKRLGIPLIQVYSIATFYKAFSLTPRGRHLLTVCLGTACHVRGAIGVLEEIERKLGIKSGETTEDNEFSLETVNCLGSCALGPIIVVDRGYHGRMTPSRVKTLLEGIKSDKNENKEH